MKITVSVCCKLPLPLGEGWGEGLALERNPPFPFLSEGPKKQRRRIFFFRLLSYALTPALSQRERESTYDELAHCEIISGLLTSPLTM